MQSEVTEGFMLSPQQRSLWLDQQRQGHGYHALGAVLIEGDLRSELLKSALQSVVDRHEILRTTFAQHPGMPFPFQVVAAAGTQPAWEERDFSNLGVDEQRETIEKFFPAEIARGFDVAEGPLVRAALLRLAPQRHVLMLNISPLCADAVTLDNIFALAGATYAGGEPEAEYIQYADFALWQHELTQGEEAETGLAYWRELQFEPLLAQPVPFELHRSDAAMLDCVAIDFEPQRTGELQAAARRYELSISTFMLSCWYSLVHRLTGQQRIVIGVHCDGRKYEDLRGACGPYAKQLPLTLSFKERARFSDVLTQLKRVSEETDEWQEYFNWESVGGDTSQSLLFPLGFEFEQQPETPAGLSWRTHTRDVRASHHKLKLRCTTKADGTLRAALDFDPRYITRESAERLAAHLREFASNAAAEPSARISALGLLDQHARRKILIELNQTAADFGPARCFHEIFEEQARQTPTLTALVCEDRSLTYAELDQQSNQLARHLRARGVGRDTIVALLAEREVELFIALLGVLKAGAAYVSFDPKYPKERLAGLIEDARPKVVLTQAKLLEQLPDNVGTVLLDNEWPRIATESDAPIESGATPDNLAYVIYTSGSTGKPKGVTVEHRQLFNYLRAARERLDLPAPATYATVSTLAADLGHTMIFPALASGGTLHVVSHERASDPAALDEYFAQQKIDCLKIVPSHLQALLSYSHASRLLPAQRLVLGGEATRWELIEQLHDLQPNCRIFNHYGPTETTVGVIAGEVEGRVEVAATLPLGRPLANTQIYLLDARLEPVPLGVAGDLYAGGAGLARGYLGHPGLTAEKFIPDPFSTQPGARLYRTGDRAVYLSDGRVEFLGRADHQVKFHGFRVELNEIRSELNRHPQVSDSIVVLAKGKGGGDMLVAYYISRQELSGSELRDFLAANILEETLPNAFVHLQKLPLTLNGKIDYQALPSVEESRQKSAHVVVTPRTPAEQILASIWTDLLGLEHLSVHDNFFELGGHSLLATQVVSRLRKAFRVELPMRDLFQWPTVAGLAARIEEARRAGDSVAAPPIEAAPREGDLPLSFAQQRLWFLNQLEPDNPAYNMFGALRLNGRLDAAALEWSIAELVARHEPLRTTFSVVDGRPVQIIAASLRIPLPLTDLSTSTDDEREAKVLRLIEAESKRPFDLAAGPLLRLSLLRLGEDDHTLLISMHHIISDAWSIAVFTRELATLYEVFTTGRAYQFTPLPLQYADFARWQREWLQGENLERELAFWKQQLEGAPPILELPTDRPRPDVQSFRGARHQQLLSTELLDGLKALSRSEGSTAFMTLLAAFNVLLHRYTGQDDIVVGTDIANRNRQELENLIGFFVNHPVLRTRMDGNPTFRELLQRVREVTLDAYAHQDLPFDKLVSALRPERDLSRMPIFQVLLVVRNTPIEPMQLSGLTVSLMEVENLTAKFDVALFLEETADGLAAVWNFSTDLFDHSTIERMANQFEQLLQSAIASPDQRLDEFELSGLDTRHVVQTASRVTHAAQSPASNGEPQNEVEEALAAIWSQVLGIEKISTHDNFFALGGDSIISIQIIARAAQQGIRLTPKHFFQHQTIAELAGVAGTAPAAQAEQGLVTGPLPLTPVQQMFFARNLPEPHAFTQVVLIEAGRRLDPSLLAEATRQLLLHHDALRLRYERGEEGWRQVNSGDVSEASFSHLDLSAVREDELDAAIDAAIEDAQSSIDLAAGALLKVTHVEQGADKPSLVLIIVHHLAVDVVSWRILLEDLQSLYEQLSEGRRPQLAAKTTAFKHWAERLAAHAGTGAFDEDARYWLDQFRGRTLPLDFDGGQNTLSSARVVTSTLGQAETQALLHELPQVYRTQVNEALLTALVRAFAAWSGERTLLVEMEGHGREEVFEDVDLSRTVGWFTSYYPVLLETDKNAGPGDELKRIKEQLRGLPSRGLSFGLLRCFGTGDESARLRECSRPEVSFNYLGQFEHGQVERGQPEHEQPEREQPERAQAEHVQPHHENVASATFGKVKRSGGASARMPGERTHLLEIDAKVIGGRLQLVWTYSDNIHRRETVASLTAHFERALRALIEHCQSPDAGGFTPSDFPDAELSQSQLDGLLARLNV